MLDKQYCHIYDAYYNKSEWLEKQRCKTKEESKDCYFNCWERPAIPYINCKHENICKNSNKEC